MTPVKLLFWIGSMIFFHRDKWFLNIRNFQEIFAMIKTPLYFVFFPKNDFSTFLEKSLLDISVNRFNIVFRIFTYNRQGKCSKISKLILEKHVQFKEFKLFFFLIINIFDLFMANLTNLALNLMYNVIQSIVIFY